MSRLLFARFLLLVLLGAAAAIFWVSFFESVCNFDWTSPRPQMPGPDSNVDSCSELEGLPVHQLSPKQISHCDQRSPTLWAYIKHHHVTKPAPPSRPYTFFPEAQSNLLKKVWPVLRKQIKGKKKKVFVEAGASDGVTASNTLWLEQQKQLGWTGVLIECHPEVLPTLRSRNRKAYIVDVCLSTTTRPSRANLTSVDGWSFSSSFGKGAGVFPEFAKTFTHYEVQTIPLYAILAALNVTEVDFFSLDIQSLEPAVLATFPFELVDVKVWVIEVDLLAPKDRAAFIAFMKSKDYFIHYEHEWDIIFIKNGTLVH